MLAMGITDAHMDINLVGQGCVVIAPVQVEGAGFYEWQGRVWKRIPETIVRKYAEEAKVAMRNIRRDGMDYVKKLKKNSEITEDDQKKAEKDLQDLLDKFIKQVDEATAAKEKELMAI